MLFLILIKYGFLHQPLSLEAIAALSLNETVCRIPASKTIGYLTTTRKGMLDWYKAGQKKSNVFFRNG